MGRAISAEFRKLFTTRMWWGMAIAVMACGGLFAVLLGMVLHVSDEQQPMGAPTLTEFTLAQTVYTAGVAFGYVLLMVIGIMTIGSEYRHQTITGTLLAVPRRATMVFAKVIALLVFGAFYGVLFLLASVGLGAATLAARGQAVFPQPGELMRTYALVLLVLGLWALIGFGLGVLIPNQVAAMLVGVGVAFILEPILGLVVSQVDGGEKVAKFLPSYATQSVLGGTSDTTGGQSLLSWQAGAGVLVAYAVVFVAIGMFLTNRRDIT